MSRVPGDSCGVSFTSHAAQKAELTMAPSQSPLSRQSIVEAMIEVLGSGAVETSDAQLKAASVDRFRKYTSVHDIYDGPIPAAIIYPESTADVSTSFPAPDRPPPRAAWRPWWRTASWWTDHG